MLIIIDKLAADYHHSDAFNSNWFLTGSASVIGDKRPNEALMCSRSTQTEALFLFQLSERAALCLRGQRITFTPLVISAI